MIKIEKLTNTIVLKYFPVPNDYTQWSFVSDTYWPFHFYAYPANKYFFLFDNKGRLHIDYSW